MTNKCPVCGNEYCHEGKNESLIYKCGCEILCPDVAIRSCPNAHRIAIERGEEIEKQRQEIERLKDALRQANNALWDVAKIEPYKPKKPDPEPEDPRFVRPPAFGPENPEPAGDGLEGHICLPKEGPIHPITSLYYSPLPKDQCPRCKEKK